MARTPRFNQAKQAAFLAAFAATGSVRQAAEAAKCSTALHYQWLDRDPNYKPRYDAAVDKACAVLEAEALQRAVEKKKVFKFTKAGDAILHPETGEPYYELKEDNQLLWKLLSSLNAKYREKSDVSISGQIDHGATEDLKKLFATVREDKDYAALRRSAAVGHSSIAGPDGTNSKPR